MDTKRIAEIAHREMENRKAQKAYVSRRMFDDRVQWEDEFFAAFRKAYYEGIWLGEPGKAMG